MKTLTFGVEIETVGLTRDALADAIARALDGRRERWEHQVTDTRGRVWKVVGDGSLSGTVNGEVVTPVLKYEDMDDLLKVVSGLAAAGARVDFSTGIHVHVGTRDLGPKAIANLVKMIAKNERLIEHALGIQERRLARYCRPIDEQFLARIERNRPRTERALNSAWYGRYVSNPDRYDSSRYYVLTSIM